MMASVNVTAVSTTTFQAREIRMDGITVTLLIRRLMAYP